MVQKVQRGWDGAAEQHFASVPQFASTTAGGIPLFQASGGGAQQAAAPPPSAAEGIGGTGGAQQQQQQQQQGMQQQQAQQHQHQHQHQQQPDGGRPHEGAAEAAGPMPGQDGAAAAAAASGSHGGFPFPADLAAHDHPCHDPSPLLRVGSGALATLAGRLAGPQGGRGWVGAALPAPCCPARPFASSPSRVPQQRCPARATLPAALTSCSTPAATR